MVQKLTLFSNNVKIKNAKVIKTLCLYTDALKGGTLLYQQTDALTHSPDYMLTKSSSGQMHWQFFLAYLKMHKIWIVSKFSHGIKKQSFCSCLGSCALFFSHLSPSQCIIIKNRGETITTFDSLSHHHPTALRLFFGPTFHAALCA